MDTLPQLKQTYRDQRAALFESALMGGASSRPMHRQLRQFASLTDDVLKGLWQYAQLPSDLALVAVGGYGRGELYPYSDVDVLVLLPDSLEIESHPDIRAAVEGFIGACWNVGLEVGSSVRTVGECIANAAQDITVQTALLESRLVQGSQTLFAELQQRYRRAMNPKAFFVAKTLEMRQRHNKYDNTPYALEPNCKESPGGLRDLQMLLWLAKAAGYGSSWDALAQAGLITPLEARNIKRNEALIGLVRTRLHLLARRGEDRLLFDLQTQVAATFGYHSPPRPQDDDSEEAERARKRAVIRPGEKLMRRYYWAAKAVVQLNQILLLNMEERLGGGAQKMEPINARFFNKAGMLEVASDDLYEKNPHAILETFLVYERDPSIWDFSARTLRALYNSRDRIDGAFRRDFANRAAFLQILKEPVGITHAMRLMNQTSVLGRYLPPFRRIVGQMQHDLFHVYTVDQHILMVLRNLRRFFMPEHVHEYPFCSQLATNWEKPWLLYVAALFHDIAKGRGADHSQLGALEVRRFCKAHGIVGDDAKMLEFLVREHLSMSTVAQKSDLGDPDVIHRFARCVGDERHLTALYLLTVADVRGTSPKVWNAWKGKLLEDLYHITLRALGDQPPDPNAEVQARKREALERIADAVPPQTRKKLWDSLDVRYFMRHDADDIAWHTCQIAAHVHTRETIVRARVSPVVGEGLQVLVYTSMLKALFARTCAYFEVAGFSVQAADVYTTNEGWALNTWQIVAQAEGKSAEELIAQVEHGLARAIHAEGPLPRPGRGRVSRRVRSFPVTPRVALTPDEKAQNWVLSISASDRVGLLYTIARILSNHGLSVEMAKIMTLGERVEDVFLLSGTELRHNLAQIAIETELLWALEG